MQKGLLHSKSPLETSNRRTSGKKAGLGNSAWDKSGSAPDFQGDLEQLLPHCHHINSSGFASVLAPVCLVLALLPPSLGDSGRGLFFQQGLPAGLLLLPLTHWVALGRRAHHTCYTITLHTHTTHTPHTHTPHTHHSHHTHLTHITHHTHHTYHMLTPHTHTPHIHTIHTTHITHTMHTYHTLTPHTTHTIYTSYTWHISYPYHTHATHTTHTTPHITHIIRHTHSTHQTHTHHIYHIPQHTHLTYTTGVLSPRSLSILMLQNPGTFSWCSPSPDPPPIA
jgi:hypothetical protein